MNSVSTGNGSNVLEGAEFRPRVPIGWLDSDSVLPAIPIYAAENATRNSSLNPMTELKLNDDLGTNWQLKIEGLTTAHSKSFAGDMREIADNGSIEHKLIMLRTILEKALEAGGTLNASFASSIEETITRLSVLHLIGRVENGKIDGARALLWNPATQELINEGLGVRLDFQDNPDALAWIDVETAVFSASDRGVLALATGNRDSQLSPLFKEANERLSGHMPSLWLAKSDGAVFEVPALENESNSDGQLRLKSIRIALGKQLVVSRHCTELAMIDRAWENLSEGSRATINSANCLVAGLIEQSLVHAYSQAKTLELAARSAGRNSPLEVQLKGLNDAEASPNLRDNGLALKESRAYVESAREAVSQIPRLPGSKLVEIPANYLNTFENKLESLGRINDLTEQHLDDAARVNAEVRTEIEDKKRKAIDRLRETLVEEGARFAILAGVVKLMLDAKDSWLHPVGVVITLASVAYYLYRLNTLNSERRAVIETSKESK